MKIQDVRIAIVGLGYVGLPLAVEFGKFRDIIGFDINEKRIHELINAHDSTLESSKEEILSAKNLKFTSNISDLASSNFFIVTVPTPIDSSKEPDLSFIKNATESIASILKKGDIVVYESTVYPGTTEEICAQLLQEKSKLIFNEDFFCGYSPERINPGDKKHRISNIKKITSGSTSEVATLIDNIYKEIITAGTYKAESIQVAEAAKIIENTQRDLNIALVNELAIIFNKMNIDTESVLKAAETKWNFISFRPGLVGGHCIGVDPYYLTYKSKSIGYDPKIILSGRELNDSMGVYVSNELINAMNKQGVGIRGAKALLMGITFKENCPDIRNTRITDIFNELRRHCVEVSVYDPHASISQVKEEYGIDLLHEIPEKKFDAIIISVAHDEFKKYDRKSLKHFLNDKGIIYDLKYMLKRGDSDLRL